MTRTPAHPPPHPARVRGACPGALVPMRVADGLLVRLRRADATLTPAQAAGLAALAARHGNGLIDLSQRANLQLRGVRDDALPALTDALRALGLLDAAPPEAERVRNIVASPACGLDPACAPVRPLALDLDAALTAAPDLWRLPAKTGFLINGGGALPLDGVAADIRFDADADGAFRVAVGGTRAQAAVLGRITADAVVAAALALARVVLALADATGAPPRRLRELAGDPAALAALRAALPLGRPLAVGDDAAPAPAPVLTAALGARQGWLGVAFPFGGLDADMLDGLAAFNRPLRLTPWRAVLLAGPAAPGDGARAQALGCVLDATDPRLALAACSGRGACDSGITDARADALDLAARLPDTLRALAQAGGVVHLSACAKGCAHPGPARVVMTAVAPGRYDLAFDAAAGGPAAMSGLTPQGVAAHLTGRQTPVGSPVPPIAPLALSRNPGVPAPTPPLYEPTSPLYEYERDGAAIYARSFAIIRAEARLDHLPDDLRAVAVRIIHAAGLVETAQHLMFSPDVGAAARTALRAGAPVLCDAQMVAHGVTCARLPAANPVICTLNDASVPDLARTHATTRSAAALELWRPHLAGAVVAIGNAPTALFHLLEMIADGAPRPAAILGFPVGFVGAAESKDALAANPWGLPYLAVAGRRGGSAMAAAAVNALASDKE